MKYKVVKYYEGVEQFTIATFDSKRKAISTISIDGIVKAVYGGDMMTIEFKGGVIGVKILFANVNGRYANVGEKVHVYGKLREFGTTFIVEALMVSPWHDVEMPKSNELDDGELS
jgi:hypothetical protein